MEFSPEMRVVTSLLKYPKVQFWKRGEAFSTCNNRKQGLQGDVFQLKMKRRNFCYDRSLHTARATSVWSELPIPVEVEAGL